MTEIPFKVLTIALLIQQIFTLQSKCPSIKFTNVTDNEWHGILALTSPTDGNAVQVQLTFDQPLSSIATNAVRPQIMDDHVLTIDIQNETLVRGEDFYIYFGGYTLFPGQTLLFPEVSEIKLNDIQICPVYENENENDTDGCLKYDAKEDDMMTLQFEGKLTIPPVLVTKGMIIDIELDSRAFAIANDLGPITTSNQKRFSIATNEDVTRPGKPLELNFFVKFNGIEEVPRVETIYINNSTVCVEGLNNKQNPYEDSESPFNDSLAISRNREAIGASIYMGVSLKNMPFHLFPNVTESPLEVDNSRFRCGSSLPPYALRLTKNAINASTGQFPFHTAIFLDENYICGGSLITEEVVLTAAHCVVDGEPDRVISEDKFQLLFGSIDMETLEGSEALREVAMIYTHPHFKSDRILRQDIALMMIKGKLQFSETINRICLFHSYNSMDSYYNNKTFTVLGFGSSDVTDMASRFLKYGRMKAIARSDCAWKQVRFGLLPEHSTFCAAEDNVIACPGDSGGALVQEIDYTYYLRGVASVTVTESNQNCNTTDAVAFTHVPYFQQWINETIELYWDSVGAEAMNNDFAMIE